MDFTDRELQYRICYAVVVAGKNAKFADRVVRDLFDSHYCPFDLIKFWSRISGGVERELRRAKTGNYKKIARAFVELATADIDLRTCAPEHLEQIHGIGPKTARFFVLWTRPDARYAALDVHVLRWLRERGYDAPRQTPGGKRYRELEVAFLREADEMRMTPAELDKQIWMAGSGFPTYNPEFKES